MQIRVKQLHPEAKTPTYATQGSACFDLYGIPHNEEKVEVSVCDSYEIPTGLAFEIPQDHVMLIFSRSGHAFKHNTRLSNCVGVIDSDYRGEVVVKLTRDPSTQPYLAINLGDRIAQAMVIPVKQVSFKEVEELTETDRGVSGFGSTGA